MEEYIENLEQNKIKIWIMKKIWSVGWLTDPDLLQNDKKEAVYTNWIH